MALDITLTKNGKITVYNEQTSISFDDDADYWHLYPTLIKDIKNKTGELLDLYDDAEFSGGNLIILKEVISSYLTTLNNQEKHWEVRTGTQTHPVKKEIYKTLIKKSLEEKLQKFLLIIDLAIEQNEKIICRGD